jgi:hypothetical protein
VIYFWIVMAGIAVFTWSADYACASMARITGDKTWLTESYKRDRVLNGLEISAKPFEDSTGKVYLTITYTNPTRYSYTIKNSDLGCGGIESGMHNVLVQIESQYVPARAVTNYTVLTSETDMVNLWATDGHMKGSTWEYDHWGCYIDVM